MHTRRLVTTAALIALYVVLGLLVSVNLGNMRLTFDALPVIIGALLFGGMRGAAIGFCGAFLVQLLSYGLTPTTILWVLPAAARGLFVGCMREYILRDSRRLLPVIAASALLVTAINTGVMALDSIIYGYYSRAYVFGALIWRVAAGVLTSLVHAAVLPPVLARLLPVYFE